MELQFINFMLEMVKIKVMQAFAGSVGLKECIEISDRGMSRSSLGITNTIYTIASSINTVMGQPG